jgi:hypothetical protein
MKEEPVDYEDSKDKPLVHQEEEDDMPVIWY